MKFIIDKKLFPVMLIIGIFIAAGFVFRDRIGMREEAAPSDTGRLNVVTTFFPLYDFTRNIAKDRVELNLLFSQTPEVSSFTPADIQKINRADMLIKNGAGLEPVLDDFLGSSDNKGIIVVNTSRGVSLLDAVGEAGYGTEVWHEHENQDPHIWLDPRNAVIQVKNIRDALSAHDPENAEFYNKNAEAYIRSLEELDGEIERETRAFSKKDIIVFHSAFRYFTERYGLKQAAVIEEFPGKEPSPRYIAGVIAIIRETGITAIFSEPQFSPRIVEVIAKDLGIAVRELDPVERGNPESDSYISIMRENTKTLKEILR